MEVETAAGTLLALGRAWIDGRRARGEISGRSAVLQRARLTALAAVHGDRRVDQLDRNTLLAWQAKIGHHAPATRRAYLSTVAGFTRWLTLEGHLEHDPAVGLAKVREPRRVPRALPATEVEKVFSACPDLRALAIVWLMVGCGLRCIEVSRLDLDDYDRVAATLQVRGKADHERVLPVPAAVGDALDAYIRQRGEAAGPLIRPNPRGRTADGRISARRVSRILYEIMTAAGVHRPGDRRTAHALRHTAASDVLDACHDLRVVQEMLGHASLSTTQVYLRRADLGRMREAMEGRSYRGAVA